MAVRASEIAHFLDLTLVGDDVEVNRPRALSEPKPHSLLFASKFSDDTVTSLNNTKNVLVLACMEYTGYLYVPHIITPRPRLHFAKVLQEYFTSPVPTGIAPTAVISPTARIGKNSYIGHFSVIGAGVEIGDNTEIRNHVVVHDNCIIGNNCRIKSNTVIGEEGFGYEFENDGTPIRIPHLGRVVIKDNVEIGALNCIARGTLDDTVLHSHVKTDDHVFIAHNVQVGENSVIIAGAEISGSVRIGKNVWIAPQATLINQIEIGDNALVGIGAVVTKSVESNMIVAGNPAKVLRRRDG